MSTLREQIAKSHPDWTSEQVDIFAGDMEFDCRETDPDAEPEEESES